MTTDLTVLWALLDVVGRGVVAALMTTAGILKLGDEEFAATISEIAHLPLRGGRVLRHVIPPLEIAAGLGLLVSPTSRPAAAVCAFLIGGYTAVMVANLARGWRDLRCACFGRRGADVISWRTVGRNCLLLIAVTPGLLPDVFVRLTVEPVLSATESVVLLTAAAGSTLAVLVLRYLLGLPELARRNEIGLPEKEMR